MPRGRPCKKTTQADDIELHWAITWPDDCIRSQLQRWAEASRLVANAEVRSVGDVVVLFIRFKAKRSYLNVQDIARKLPDLAGMRPIRIQSLTAEQFASNLHRDNEPDTAAGLVEVDKRLAPAVRAALKDSSRIDLSEVFEHPAPEWPEDLVAEYLRCANRTREKEPTLEAITHVRRCGKKACYEFKCSLCGPKGPAVPFWIRYVDLLKNVQWAATLASSTWRIQDHLDDYTSGESAYAESFASNENGTCRRRTKGTVRKIGRPRRKGAAQ